MAAVAAEHGRPPAAIAVVMDTPPRSFRLDPELVPVPGVDIVQRIGRGRG